MRTKWKSTSCNHSLASWYPEAASVAEMEPFPVPGVEKTVLHAGKGDIPHFQKNTKVFFHFRALVLTEERAEDGEQSVLDDSRTLGTGPFELLVGRQFKLGIWEEMVKTMRVGEVAQFNCPFKLVIEYPNVSKALREMALKKAGKEVPHSHTHTCGFGAMQGTGHADLDRLYQQRKPLTFQLELLQVEQPGEYKKDSWAMSAEEKDTAIDRLREEGNALYRAGNRAEACDKYFEALGYLEELSLRKKPKSDEWEAIERRKVPLLLNYSQCMLLKGDFAEVIRHTTTVLEVDRDNIKALFRRAKAHAASWDKEAAEADFERVVQLDPSLAGSVGRERVRMEEGLERERETERTQWQGKLF